jgi:hypothetical protein
MKKLLISSAAVAVLALSANVLAAGPSSDTCHVKVLAESTHQLEQDLGAPEGSYSAINSIVVTANVADPSGNTEVGSTVINVSQDNGGVGTLDVPCKDSHLILDAKLMNVRLAGPVSNEFTTVQNFDFSSNKQQSTSFYNTQWRPAR